MFFSFLRSPFFRAPEQVSLRARVFSLYLILYHISDFISIAKVKIFSPEFPDKCNVCAIRARLRLHH